MRLKFSCQGTKVCEVSREQIAALDQPHSARHASTAHIALGERCSSTATVAAKVAVHMQKLCFRQLTIILPQLLDAASQIWWSASVLLVMVCP